MFTITCGLLIALGLEDAAEAVHHRFETQGAEESLRGAVRQNRDDALAAAAGLRSKIQNMRAVLAYTEARSEGRPADASGLDLTFHEGHLANAAWTTAVSTGRLRLMPHEQAERFAAAYKEQELLQSSSEQALNDSLELWSFAPHAADPCLQLSTATAQSALPYVRALEER